MKFSLLPSLVRKMKDEASQDLMQIWDYSLFSCASMFHHYLLYMQLLQYLYFPSKGRVERMFLYMVIGVCNRWKHKHFFCNDISENMHYLKCICNF